MTYKVGDRVEWVDPRLHSVEGVVDTIHDNIMTVAWDNGTRGMYVIHSAPYQRIRKIVSKTESPWYPDNTSEWVEVPLELMEMPEELDPDDDIQCLLAGERADKRFVDETTAADGFAWDYHSDNGGRVVAYKVIRRAKEYNTEDEKGAAAKIVTAFNAITGYDLSEFDGTLLLQIVNEVRSRSTK